MIHRTFIIPMSKINLMEEINTKIIKINNKFSEQKINK